MTRCIAKTANAFTEKGFDAYTAVTHCGLPGPHLQAVFLNEAHATFTARIYARQLGQSTCTSRRVICSECLTLARHK